MTCPERAEQIALYIEGDLPEDDALRLEGHFAACVACRQFAAELSETQDTIRSLRLERVETSTLGQIRSGVMDRLQQETLRSRRSGSIRLLEALLFGSARWRYALGGLALAGLVGLGVLGVRQARDSGPRTDDRALSTVHRPLSPPSTFPTVHLPPATIQRPLSPAPATGDRPPAGQDMVVKIYTDDPNIIIYWLVEQNGGSE